MGYSEKNLEEHLENSLIQVGYKSRLFSEYDKVLCSISDDIIGFIKDTQEKEYKKLTDQYGSDTDKKLVLRINNEISSRGLIDVLRKGVKDRGCNFRLVFFQPKTSLNPEHQELFKKNRFVVVRQLHFSTKNEKSIDMVLFINGLPFLTMELKNQLTNQTILDSERQYKYDRDPKEQLLQFQRVIVHFCCDNDRVSMTTRLSGDKTKFLPYNKGIDNPETEGLRTNYLWKEVLIPNSVLDILENFVHLSVEKEKEWSEKENRVVEKKTDLLVFPRYHQLDVIRKIRETLIEEGVGRNYLIQHTTGSGKSYEIGWLSHLLTSLYQSPSDTKRIFDSIIVITDRKVIDRQLQYTIKQLEQTKGVVNPVDINSSQLKDYLEKGKDIIISTIQKFPQISETINELPGHNFGIIVDEVHSSQSGETSKHLKKSLSVIVEVEEDEDDEYTDVDRRILEEIRSRGKKNNLSFFGFTGTPKNKTLEIFGRKNEEGKYVPFHIYSMKQSITEGFTLDVLQNFTTYSRWFKLNKDVEEDKELPKDKVMEELVRFVDGHSITIRHKVKIILDHFIKHTSKKIQGKSRGMVVVRSRKHCVLYFHEMRKQMKEMGLPYSCLVGFSGVVLMDGQEYTEDTLNKLPPKVSIPEGLKDPSYRILIVSNKFQTGYDEPLLHSMFIDKTLGGLQCVQTLSRLNRKMTGKTDTFVLDFVNEPKEIYSSFKDYYEDTMLEEETDPNRLYTLQNDIEGFNLFTKSEVDEFSKIFYNPSVPQEQLQPVLNKVVDKWKEIQDEDQKELFRSNIQSYIRLYGYITQIMTFTDLDLEKLFVFVKYLNKKLPKRKKPDVLEILNSVDLESFRIQQTFSGKIDLEGGEKGGILKGIDVGSSKGTDEPELDFLSQIINQINEVYGSEITEQDKVDLENVKNKVVSNVGLRKVLNGDNSETNKRKKFDDVLNKTILSYVNERFDFFKKIDDPKIKSFIGQKLYDEIKSGKLNGYQNPLP
jgi:type I restriction enzyme R subunit